MRFLLDTVTISETVKPSPDRNVMDWLGGVEDATLFVSVLSFGEIRKGIERLPDRDRRDRLERWLSTTLPAWFGARLLTIDVAVADLWGRRLGQIGRSVPIIDSLIAATALHHDLRLVTRNERDFALYPELVVVNPWRA